VAIADLYGPQMPPAPEMAPAMPAQPAPAAAPAPVPLAQRTFSGYIAQQRNDPANWVTLTNQGAVRNLPIVEQLQRNLQTAIASVYGPGYQAQVYSGGQAPIGSGQRRVGSTRHDGGMAADLHILDPQGNRVTGDKLAAIGRHWLENRIGGVGLEMRGGGIHLDMHQGRAPVWTYGPVSPAQAALVREFGGRAVAQGPQGANPVGRNRGQPGAPQPPMQGVQMAEPTMPIVPDAPPMIPNMFASSQQRIDEARQAEEEAVRARRRALFSGPSPFG
jgi:hypothetical protein